MISEDDVGRALDWLVKNAAAAAKARADVAYLEEYRKSQKAMLMKVAMTNGIKTVAAAEIEAYADAAYVEILKGLAAAVEQEETLRWGLVSAQARIEVWRSTEASNRVMDRAAM